MFWSASGATNIAQPTGNLQGQGYAVGQILPSSVENFIRQLTNSWLQYLDTVVLRSMLGDGSDGAAVLDGVQTMSWATRPSGSYYVAARNPYVTSIQVASGAQLNMNGFILTSQDDVTTIGPWTPGGRIFNNGNPGSTNPAGAGAGATGLTTGTLLGSAGGGTGTAGVSLAGGTGAFIGNSFGGAGGTGAMGSTLGSNHGTPGGLPGIAFGPTSALGSPHDLLMAQYGAIRGITNGVQIETAIAGGAGGGGGGGDSLGGDGGGGGGGGGPLVIRCRNLNVSTGTDLQCAGGQGATGGPTGGGGGGGGGGGWMSLLYSVKPSGIGFTGTWNCPGGPGGPPAGSSGQTGSTGAAGSLFNFQLG